MKTLPRLAASALALALVAAPVHAAYAADSSEIAALKKQLRELSAKVESLEAEQKATAVKTQEVAAAEAAKPAAPAANDVVTKGSFPGSFKVPGTDTSVKFGGYVKADMMNDIGQSYDSAFSVFNAIPLNNTASKDKSFDTHFTAKQTRLNMETRTNTSLGEMKTFVEVDFYGTSGSNSNLNGYAPQLRHAYGSLAGWTAGQTWTNFMDVNAANESLDYLGAAGRVFVRQGQIRYEHAFGDLTASASVEGRIMSDNTSSPTANMYTTYTAAGAVTTPTSESRMAMPDMTLRGDYKYAKDGYVSVRGLLAQTNIDSSTATGAADNHTATDIGYGIGLSGKQGTWGKDNFSYDLNYGDGTGRYLFDVGTQANLYNQTTRDLHAVKYYAATAGYQHYWSDEFRSNLFGGYLHKVNDMQEAGAQALAGSINRDVASGHVNLIWQPAPAYSVGLEYMRGYRKVESGEEGNLNRFVTSFQYKF